MHIFLSFTKGKGCQILRTIISYLSENIFEAKKKKKEIHQDMSHILKEH